MTAASHGSTVFRLAIAQSVVTLDVRHNGATIRALMAEAKRLGAARSSFTFPKARCPATPGTLLPKTLSPAGGSIGKPSPRRSSWSLEKRQNSACGSCSARIITTDQTAARTTRSTSSTTPARCGPATTSDSSRSPRSRTGMQPDSRRSRSMSTATDSDARFASSFITPSCSLRTNNWASTFMLVSSYSDDPAFALLAQGHAALNSYWVSLAVPAQYSHAAPSGLADPNGDWAARCPSDASSELIVVDIDRDNPSVDTAVNKRRLWRRVARQGDTYRIERTARHVMQVEHQSGARFQTAASSSRHASQPRGKSRTSTSEG